MFGCGGCANAHNDHMQVVTYPNEIFDLKKEREKRRSLSTPEKRTIYLPFADFQQLLTKKVLKQIREAEEDAIVEGTSHSVSCFLWQPEQHL